jgi:tau tubulin kinase
MVKRHPRQAAGFRGTIRYASYSCHLDREQSQRDDVEAWFYTLIELTTGKLPWRDLTDRAAVSCCLLLLGSTDVRF